jgi:Concanavalin A-like lectin/glucanases superfamily
MRVRNQRRQLRRFCVLIETLEGRRLLSSVVATSLLSDSIVRPIRPLAIVVTSLSDVTSLPNGLIDLRMAIARANASTLPTGITFDPTVFSSNKTILLANGPLKLSNTKKPITIAGPAAGVTVSGNQQGGVFFIDEGVTANLSGLTIVHGAGGGAEGGGGSGIENQGILTLSDATVSHNSANIGGGILNNSLNANLTLINVTIAGNSADFAGGGIYNELGTMTLTNVTVSGNKAGTDGAGGIYNNAPGPHNPVAQLANCIVAGNSVADPFGQDVEGAFTSFGNNLIGSTDDSAGWNSTDLTGTAAHPLDPKLGALGNNRGPTQTMLPMNGSPAINAGSNALIPHGITTDQRGLPRIYGGTVDIGAVEVQPIPSLKLTPPPTVISHGRLITHVFYYATAGQGSSEPLGSFTESNTSGPYTVDVNWGDGSTDTTFTMTAAGAIPNHTHTFPSAGSDTVKITVKDSAGLASNTGAYPVTVSPAKTIISGTVFDDPNKNGKRDSGEAGLGGRQVYDDANNNGKFDTGEPFDFTNSSGGYSLAVEGTGTVTVRQIMPANWTQTAPTNNAGIKITLSPNSTKAGTNFGDTTTIKYLKTVATTSGIVAWWTFDSASQANSILNGYTGSLAGGAQISASGKGSPITGETGNTGLVLNGTSANVTTNLTTQQEFTAAATFNVWVNLGSTPAKSGHIYEILAKSQAGNDLDLQVETDGSVHFYTDNGTSTSFKPASLTGWHMLTAEYDIAAKTRKIFWDGKQVASSTPGAHSASTQPFTIGASAVLAGRFFNGSIDEVSLWNRALTATEVTAIYNSSK